MQELNTREVQIGGYIHSYIKDNKTKTKFIPIEMKDAFIEKFGHDLLNADEKEVDVFIENQRKIMNKYITNGDSFNNPNDLLDVNMLEPKMSNRFKVIFPDEFNIPCYLISSISNPRYIGNKWAPIEIKFLDPICPSTSDLLLRLIPAVIKFRLVLQMLDPIGLVIETWNISVNKELDIDFGSYDYANGNRREIKMTIYPERIMLSNKLKKPENI